MVQRPLAILYRLHNTQEEVVLKSRASGYQVKQVFAPTKIITKGRYNGGRRLCASASVMDPVRGSTTLWDVFHQRLRVSGLAIVIGIGIGISSLSSVSAQNESSRSTEVPPLKMWYDKPASEWNHSLPVGNGRLGAMVFGGTEVEHIQLNEETLWSGGPYDPTREGGAEALPEIQRLLFAGDFERAHDLFGRTMMGVPYEQMKYQPLGDLWLSFPGHDSATDYRRELDLDDAIVRVSYVVDGVTFVREVFSSAVDQILVVHMTADRPGALSFSTELHGVRNPDHSNYGTDYFQWDGLPPDGLRITGKSSEYLGIEGKIRYEARVQARSDGKIWVDYKTLHVDDATEATLVLAAATNFVNYHDVSGSANERVARVLKRVDSRGYRDIRADHIAEYRSFFDRVRLRIGPEGTAAGTEAGAVAGALPTDERIARFATHPDPGLAALYYQFGRYLLISSSRPGTEPADLQGIWNDMSNPWWDSKYTVNINLPMNYWPAESGNLSELVEPLTDLIRDVSETGVRVAREHWGARGWVLHQNTDIWRASAPMDGPSWGAWPVGGAWLTTHLWDHYLYTGDEEFLRDVYPVMKNATIFLSDILVRDPDSGWLVTAPSNSPENFPAWPGNGRFFDEVSGLYLKARTITYGPTMDMQIIRGVFSNFIKAAAHLGRDAVLSDSLSGKIARLAPDQIGKHGQLQEWIVDWDEIEPKHRHLSPLWGLYPGTEISLERTPDLARAAEESIRRRGTGGCGWSYSWKMNLRARLREGNEALDQFRALVTDSSLPNLFSLCGRALQIDGNLGATAGIAEMLLQSQDGEIQFLPALPREWTQGEVSGLRARGGFEIGIRWNEGQLERASVRSDLGSDFLLRTDRRVQVTSDGNGVGLEYPDRDHILFQTVAGNDYQIVSLD